MSRAFDALLAQQRRRQRDRLLAAAVLGALVSAAAVCLLGLSGWFITGAAIAGVAGGTTLQAFNYLMPSAGIRFLAIVRTAARYGERVAGHEAALKALAALRPALFRAIAAAPASRALSLSGGEASARMVQDIDAVQTLFVRLSAPWSAGAGLLAALILSLMAGGAAALTIVAAVIAAVIVAALIAARLAAPAGRDAQVAMGALKDDLAALQAASPELRAYGLQDWAVERSAQRGRDLDAAVAASARAGGWIAASQSLLTGLAVAGVLMVSVGTSLPLAALAALAAVTAIEAGASLANALRQNGQAGAAVSRLSPLFDVPATPTRAAPADATIRLGDLRLSPPARLAIGGRSGAGKTTLVERLLALRDPVADEASLGGCDLTDVDPAAARGLFAYASQDIRLLAGTVRDNLTLADPAATEDALWAVLETVDLADRIRADPQGLNAWLGENGETLSGGERRRLNLARALLRPAPWLVLDEPTEGLDAVTEARVLAGLSAHLARTGQGLILISHRLAPLALCDRRIEATGVAADGRVRIL